MGDEFRERIDNAIKSRWPKDEDDVKAMVKSAVKRAILIGAPLANPALKPLAQIAQIQDAPYNLVRLGSPTSASYIDSFSHGFISNMVMNKLLKQIPEVQELASSMGDESSSNLDRSLDESLQAYFDLDEFKQFSKLVTYYAVAKNPASAFLSDVVAPMYQAANYVSSCLGLCEPEVYPSDLSKSEQGYFDWTLESLESAAVSIATVGNAVSNVSVATFTCIDHFILHEVKDASINDHHEQARAQQDMHKEQFGKACQSVASTPIAVESILKEEPDPTSNPSRK